MAPQSKLLDKMMNDFLTWLRTGKNKTEGLIRAGIAHFYFVIIHPLFNFNYLFSSTSRNLTSKSFIEKGLCMNCTPSSSTPWCAITSAV